MEGLADIRNSKVDTNTRFWLIWATRRIISYVQYVAYRFDSAGGSPRPALYVGGRVTGRYEYMSTSWVWLGEVYCRLQCLLSYSSTNHVFPCWVRRLTPYPTCQTSLGAQPHVQAWPTSMVGPWMCVRHIYVSFFCNHYEKSHRMIYDFPSAILRALGQQPFWWVLHKQHSVKRTLEKFACLASVFLDTRQPRFSVFSDTRQRSKLPIVFFCTRQINIFLSCPSNFLYSPHTTYGTPC